MRKTSLVRLVESPSRIALSFIIVAASGNAWSDNLPLSLSISETLSRDNNLYRVAPGEYAVADTVSSTGLTLGLDKSYGRQRYYSSINVAANRYFDSTKLNNNSYNVNLGITSEFLNKGLLQLSGGATQSLARFDVANSNSVVTSEKNLQNTSQMNGQISYGGYGQLNPYASIQHFQQGFTYTNPNYQSMNQNTYGLGVQYSIVPQLSLGLGGRYTSGDIDYDEGNGLILGDNMRRRDFDLTANWTATGLSTLYARISATRSKDTYENAQIESATSKGVTGEIDWNYTPQGKFEYFLSFVRDSGNVGRGYDTTSSYFGSLTESVKSQGISVTQNNENNRLANTLNGKITWDTSYKFKLNAAFLYTKYHLYQTTSTTLSDGSTIDPTQSLPTEKSRYTQYSIGGKYSYARWLDLYCDIKRIKRTQDAEYQPFNATVTACTGQFNINGMN